MIQKKITTYSEIPISFRSEGQQIIGILHLPKRKKAPLIIICHGWAGNHLGTRDAFFVKAAREFSRNNFAVLRFDFRGSGDSEGDFEKQTITSMRKDLNNIINQINKINDLNNRIDIEKICLIGYSRGAFISLLEAVRNKKVRCLVSWMGALTGVYDYFAPAWLEEIKRKGFYERPDGIQITKNYINDYSKYNARETAKLVKIPVLLIYGEKDNKIPPSIGIKFSKLVSGRSEIIILRNLNHSFSGKIQQKEVIKITLDWIKNNLA